MPSTLSGKVAVGHPIDVATGTLFHDFEDYVLPGRMPLIFGRRYSSALIGHLGGMFGAGWSSPFEMRIRRDLEGYRMIAEDGESEIVFDDPSGVVDTGGTVCNLGAFHELRREHETLIVTRWDPERNEIIRYVFSTEKEGQSWALKSRQDVEGQGFDIEHDHAGRIIALRQRRERPGYRLVYDEDGRVLEVYVMTEIIEQRDGNSETRNRERLVLRYGYDRDHRLAECLDAVDNRSSYEYDAAGRMTREINAGGMMFRFRYDRKGRCIETSGPDGFGRTALQFDEGAELTRVSNALDNITTYVVNTHGQVEREISPLGNVRVTEYDAYGRIVQRVSPSGVVTSYEYDSSGDRVKVTAASGTSVSYHYNANHQVVSIIDPAGYQWQRSYDASGRLVRFVNPLSATLSFTYDNRGDLVRIEDPAGNMRHFVWDTGGRLIAADDWLGNRSEYQYDDEGRVIAFTDPLGNRTTSTRDTLGRLARVYLPDGTERNYSWDVYNQMTAFIDERGGMTRWRYSTCGLPTELIRPHGGRIRMTYTAVPGQLESISNENDERYQYEYDTEGRMIRETDFAGRSTRYEYDQNGLIVFSEDASGDSIRLIRNQDGAVVAVEYSDGTQTIYEYDARGLLLRADNGDCPVDFAYDEVGRVVRERQGEHEILSEYDAVGNRVRRTSSRGRTVNFEWDANRQLTRIRSRTFGEIRFKYDACQDETARFIPDGIIIDQRYDIRRRCVEQDWRVNASRPRPVIANRSTLHGYAYDGTGNLTGMHLAQSATARYTYDVANRVLESDLPSLLTEHFSYDLTDNITALECVAHVHPQGQPGRPCSTQSFRYDPGNRLTARDSVRYEYDTLGQLVCKRDGDGETQYIWKKDGQLSGVRLPDGSEWSYRYDALGRRVEKSNGSHSISFVWDGDVVLHEVRSAEMGKVDVVDWEFNQTDFAPIVKTEQGVPYLFVNDTIGLPRVLLTSEGAVRWAADFTTFGEEVERASASTVDCPVRFQGHWYDPETQLHYNRFRYYDPTTGHYISPDPIGIAGGLNVYVYRPNPFKWFDPYGLTEKCPLKYPLKPEDEDWRGQNKTLKQALDEAFSRTGVPRGEFEVTAWGKDKNGKSFPVEWRHPSGAEVNIDGPHGPSFDRSGSWATGPDAPHVGWQSPGKRSSGGGQRGHIILDDVPVNR